MQTQHQRCHLGTVGSPSRHPTCRYLDLGLPWAPEPQGMGNLVVWRMETALWIHIFSLPSVAQGFTIGRMVKSPHRNTTAGK